MGFVYTVQLTVTAEGYFGKKFHKVTVIAMYYLEAIRRLRVAPSLLRCDHGTENSTLSLIQPFFRYNDSYYYQNLFDLRLSNNFL